MKSLERKEMERKIIEKINPSGPAQETYLKKALIGKTNAELERICKAHGIEIDD